MSDASKCDACGDLVEQKGLTFEFHEEARQVEGTLFWHNGSRVDWPFADTRGDLCPTCTTALAEALIELMQ